VWPLGMLLGGHYSLALTIRNLDSAIDLLLNKKIKNIFFLLF
jgi:hypothetical protein